jgi:hypothetical protein
MADENYNSLAIEATTRRNRLLYETDWTQLPDVPLANKAAWATYRQALRDVPTQSGYPVNVVWPTPPQ